MVVDLEATSTGSKAKIIQVGIVVIEDGEIVEQYATESIRMNTWILISKN